MDPQSADKIRTLLQQRIAALGTLNHGEPYVSMVPFALAAGSVDFIIHVSRLAAHTKDMLANPKVSLLVVAPLLSSVPTQATARMTVQADAEPLAESAHGHAEAKEAYLARFPESAMMFELSDFSLFALRPRSIRFVGGFAQAKTITPEGLARIIGQPSGLS